MNTIECLQQFRKILDQYQQPYPQVLLDIGCSDFRWTEEFFQVFGPIRTHGLDPHPAHIQGQKNYHRKHFPLISFEQAAASDKEGKDLFDVSDMWGGALSPTGAGKTFQAVNTVRLDKEIERRGLEGSTFLKLDTHGAEQKILRGLGAVHPDFLFIEVYWHKLSEDCLRVWELTTAIVKNGYLPLLTCEESRRELDGAAWQADWLFAKKDFPAFKSNQYK